MRYIKEGGRRLLALILWLNNIRSGKSASLLVLPSPHLLAVFWALDTSAFVDSLLHQKELKFLIFNCIATKVNTARLRFFLQILSENIFMVPKCITGPWHCMWEKLAQIPLGCENDCHWPVVMSKFKTGNKQGQGWPSLPTSLEKQKSVGSP